MTPMEETKNLVGASGRAPSQAPAVVSRSGCRRRVTACRAAGGLLGLGRRELRDVSRDSMAMVT